MAIIGNGMVFTGVPLKINNTIAPVVPVTTPNPIIFLDAGNTNSYSGTGNIWTDLSGFGNNQIFNTTPLFKTSGSGGSGSFLYSSGSNYASSSAAMSGLPNGATQWTISVWCWVDNTYSGLGSEGIVGWGDTGSNINTMLTDNSTGLGGNIVEVRGHAQDRPAVYGLSIGQWFNAVFTNDTTVAPNGEKWSYLNGAAQPTYPGSGVSNPSTAATAQGTPGKFGTFQSIEGRTTFRGRIGLVKMWNVALTGAQVATEFNTYRNRYNL